MCLRCWLWTQLHHCLFALGRMSSEGSLLTLNCRATRLWGGLGSEEEIWSGVLWDLILETTFGVVRQWPERPRFLMWCTMHLTMSWFVLRLWWKCHCSGWCCTFQAVVSAALWCWNWSQEKNHCYCQERRGGRTVTQVFLLLGGSLVCWFLNIYFIFFTLMYATTKDLFEIVVAVAI